MTVPEATMRLAQRIMTHLKGGKLVRLMISPRANRHFLINSPDLPGFSIMLLPGDIESPETISAALVPPLEAFITAEYRAYLQEPSRQDRGGRVSSKNRR